MKIISSAGPRPAKPPTRLRSRLNLYLPAFFPSLVCFAVTIGLSVWAGVPNWDALVCIPLYVFLGFAAAQTLRARRTRKVLHATHDVGAVVILTAAHRCGWAKPVLATEPAAALRPVLHHVMTDCPDPQAVRFRDEHPVEAEEARRDAAR